MENLSEMSILPEAQLHAAWPRLSLRLREHSDADSGFAAMTKTEGGDRSAATRTRPPAFWWAACLSSLVEKSLWNMIRGSTFFICTKTCALLVISGLFK